MQRNIDPTFDCPSGFSMIELFQSKELQGVKRFCDGLGTVEANMQ